jgi:glycosyltransferase involved in cell wall biosynthesis
VRGIAAILSPIPVVLLQNSRTSGAAGAWNTGLASLGNSFHGYVALLDDDDEWDRHHLEANQAIARTEEADVVVSGLRRVVDGIEIARSLPSDLRARDFLTGNPGWQGSNTYVSMRRLALVRGFRDGLASLNDRDLAVRLLRSPGVRVGYTGEWTSTWHVRADRETLSTPRSRAKISGLRWFWRIYGAQMSLDEQTGFFQRADRCFGVARSEIIDPGSDVPPHTYPHGDFAYDTDEQLRQPAIDC